MSTVDEVRHLLGQSLLIGFNGFSLSTDMQKFIKENSIGGATLFACNYENPLQVAELSEQLHNCSSFNHETIPFMLAVDHEGGKVQRFKPHFTHFPEPRVIGDTLSPKIAYEYAQVMAKELLAVGVNITYAPLADIHTNPSNPVIGRRAFAESEEIVSKMVSAFVRGCITAGIQPVVKHFPGHGDTSEDSHFHLPKVDTTLETLREREFKPFVKAFKARCALLMTAHIIVKSVEPQLPVTFSKNFLQNILRDDLRYRGLIISDDMEMKAISDNFGDVEAPLMALEAGCDLLIYHTEDFLNKVYEPLLGQLTSPKGAAALSMLKQANQRILSFKNTNFKPFPKPNKDRILSILKSTEHLDVLSKLNSP